VFAPRPKRQHPDTPGDAPTVWASACGESKVTYGQPAGGDALKFRFGRSDPVYRKRVSTRRSSSTAGAARFSASGSMAMTKNSNARVYTLSLCG